MKRTVRIKLSLGVLFISFSLGQKSIADQITTLPIYYGYITQVHCKGKLYLSSVGNPKLVTLNAVPKEFGCSALLSPEFESGGTDLLLKTSTGDIHIALEIKKPRVPVSYSQLEVNLEPSAAKKDQR